MSQLDLSFHGNKPVNATPPQRSFKTPTLLSKATAVYFIWNNFYRSLPKIHKYTLGQKIDGAFIEMIATLATALFTATTEKQPVVESTIQKNETLKILLMIIWESKSLDDKKYLELSEKINEIGRMLGGWNGSLIKQNSPDKKAGEK